MDLKKLSNSVSKEDLTFNSATCNSSQKWNNDKSQFECKSIVHSKKIIVGVLAHIFVITIDI